MDLGLSGRTAIVTGGSTGLGFSAAQALVAEGAQVVVSSRHQDKVDQAVNRLTQLAPGAATGLAVDLADPDAADRVMQTATRAFGSVDIAVLSVGGPPPGQISAIDDAQWRSSFETIFLGPLRVARAVLASGDDKAVTFILSTSVKSPVANLGISNALRPGLAGAAKMLADEYGPRGSRVTAVLPGRVDTARIRELEAGAGDVEELRRQIQQTIPLRRYGRPEELGKVAAFLVSDAASYLTGIAVPVDGGALRLL